MTVAFNLTCLRCGHSWTATDPNDPCLVCFPPLSQNAPHNERNERAPEGRDRTRFGPSGADEGED